MVVRRRRGSFAAAVLGCFVFTALASPSFAAPVVPGFERYGQDDTHRSQAGQLLLGELNCVLCHEPPQASPAAKQGPVLDQVAQRVRAGYLRRFLTDPHQVKPGTTMPQVFPDDPDRDAKVEALVHFLVGGGAPRHDRVDNKAVNTGRDLYHKIGCVACHGSRNAKGEPEQTTAATVPLVDLRSKYTIPSLAMFLENPHQVRPAGRMPLLLLDTKERPKEARELAQFLLQGIKPKLPTGRGTTQFAYYEGDYQKLPKFAKLNPKTTGVGPAFDLAAARRRTNYAMKFEGYFKVEKEGKYQFHLTSDDGSRLEIDDSKVVDNDGIHPPQSKSSVIVLTAGTHKVVVSFFQGGGGDELAVEIEGPNLGRQSLGELVVAEEAALTRVVKPVVARDDPDYLDVQPSLAEKGKALFASAGCASCHQIKGIATKAKATPLAKLSGNGGCLAPTPVKSIPWFGLSDAQRKALADAIRQPTAPSKEPALVLARTFLTFNCYACHVRDKIGGPEDALNKLFLTNQQEMGDEARIPPPLENIGGKLRPEYLRQILDRGSHDRPYMLTRMPAFGAANVGHLQSILGEMDKGKFQTAPTVTFDEPSAKVKAAGRHMVGAQAFSCIKCHTFAGFKSEGVQGIDMTLLPQRLQRDWFHAYLEDPQKIRPGTRMPTFYDKGKSLLANVLGGVPAKQSEAIWVYLLDGKKAQLPIGVKKSSESIPLVPAKNAIVYRNFIEGVGTRAIAVGYPEKINVAFDANEMRLALIWHGAFIDAGRHWSGRGQGFEPPLGDNVLGLPAGPAFAVLGDSQEAWPTTPAKAQGYRFRGYQLTPDERPTFRYALGDIQVDDFPNAAVNGKDAGLRRTLTLTAAKDVSNLYFRAAVGTKIEPQGDGVYRIDGHTTVRLPNTPGAVIRQSAGKAELVVPVTFTNHKAQIVEEIAW